MRDKSGKYLLTSQLGAGGMGQVWSAIKQGDDGLRMPCAIKVLHPALAMTDEDRERFFGEARIAAQLDHGRIVKVIDTSEVQGSPCLVMEWVDGVNLRNLLERAERAGTRRLGVDIALYIVGEILAALEYAHGRTVAGQHAGLVHYDVTPGNILISSSGEVKLTDFGIARYAKTSEATMSRSVGTPRYMSPEQMSGRVRPQTDIYSLGVVLHELLEGERYLGNYKFEEFQSLVLGGHIPDLTQPDIPTWVDELRRRMLTARPEDRPSAGDAHWMIVQHTTRYQVAARELKVLYAQVVGRPRSGFTDVIRLPEGGLPEPAIDGNANTRAEAPAAPPLPSVQVVEQPRDHATIDRTNTAAPPSDTPPCEPTLRLPTPRGSVPASEVTEQTAPEPRVLPTYLLYVAIGVTVVMAAVFVWSAVQVLRAKKEPLAGDQPVVAAGTDPADEEPVEPQKSANEPEPELEPPTIQSTPAPEPKPAPEPGQKTAPDPGPIPVVEPPPPKTDPDPEPKPKPAAKPSIEVAFVIEGVSKAELEVGRRTLAYEKFALTKLKPGSYPVRWRERATDPWKSSGTLQIENGLPPGSFYDVKLTATSLVVTKGVEGSAK